MIVGAHLVTTLAMVGLIWFVQLVHYPLFTHADRDGFPAFEREHQRRTTWIVAPLMLVELASALALAFVVPSTALGFPALAGLGLVALIWLSTALIQVPCHARLSRGFDAAAAARLVRGNWLRTAAWTLRGGIAVQIAMPPSL